MDGWSPAEHTHTEQLQALSFLGQLPEGRA